MGIIDFPDFIRSNFICLCTLAFRTGDSVPLSISTIVWMSRPLGFTSGRFLRPSSSASASSPRACGSIRTSSSPSIAWSYRFRAVPLTSFFIRELSLASTCLGDLSSIVFLYKVPISSSDLPSSSRLYDFSGVCNAWFSLVGSDLLCYFSGTNPALTAISLLLIFDVIGPSNIIKNWFTGETVIFYISLV